MWYSLELVAVVNVVRQVLEDRGQVEVDDGRRPRQQPGERHAQVRIREAQVLVLVYVCMRKYTMSIVQAMRMYTIVDAP